MTLESLKNVDLTPSPRVLRMLGQIDFAPWQCLAELIDNSIDAFIDSQGATYTPKVNILLPRKTELDNGQGTLIVQDNGSGMEMAMLEQSVRAGYSGNDPVEKMGLFGMGFNISTARLGRRTEVWTTTREALKWVGVVIDFDELERTKSFHAPVVEKAKSDDELHQGVHGTQICIGKLEPNRIRPLIFGSGKASTKKRLGQLYGRIMTDLGVEITYDGQAIKGWQHCCWNPDRTVPTTDFGHVPARLDIDVKIPSRRFCTTCWVWLSENETVCPACGKEDTVVERERKLKGWIGIQRYFDATHYGIDLIRNGRRIELLDKSLFDYVDENQERVSEYPVDALHWGGRIVGELEVNFVRVSHQKDSFDKFDPEWQHVVDIVRGKSPIRPKICDQMGLPRNNSPLGRLFAGYRLGKIGLRNLVPGDETTEGWKGLNTGLVQEYKDRFYAGESDYQGDEKWYELVVRAEAGKRGSSGGSRAAGGDFPGVGNGSAQTDSSQQDNGDQPDDVEVQFERDAFLSRVYELDEISDSVSVSVIVERLVSGTMGNPFSVEPGGLKLEFRYDPANSFFEDSLVLPLDCLLLELSHHFLTITAQTIREWPLSVVERSLRKKYFPNTLDDVSEVAEEARAIFGAMREHLSEALQEEAPFSVQDLGEEMLERIKRQALAVNLGDNTLVDDVLQEGSFAKYLDDMQLIKLLGLYPQLSFDDKFFHVPHANLEPELKTDAISTVVEAMRDVRWLHEDATSVVSKDTAWRLKFWRALGSLRLVVSWRS